MSPETRGPRRVEFRIVGDVTQVAGYLFGDVQYVVEPVTTTVVGEVADEQEIVDLCHRIRDAGIELVGLRRIPGDPASLGLTVVLALAGLGGLTYAFVILANHARESNDQTSVRLEALVAVL